MPEVRVTTILILEDDPINLEFIQHLLKLSGYNTLVASNELEVLQFSDDATRTIDLLLADIVLKGCHGTKVASRLAVTRPGLRILFMSGYPLDYLSDELHRDMGALAAGRVFFLQKPFTGAGLRAKIAEAFGFISE